MVASPFKSAYVSANHGIAGLTRTAALEVAEHGITVNAICPGYVMTPLVEKQIPDTAKPRVSQKRKSSATSCWRLSRPSVSSPLRSLLGSPSSCAQSTPNRLPERCCPSAAGLRIDGREMRQDEVLKLPSMPAAGPSYPAGPYYRFIDREFLVITYETDQDVIRDHLPEPLEPIEQPLVHYEWIKMPDCSGFGSYTECGMVIPSRLRGEEVNFVTQMYLDDDPPIAAGREIWGFPKKYAHPKLEIVKDTLTGTLSYAGQLVAVGTMGYKHESMAGNGEHTRSTLSKTQINLKLIPGVDGHPEIAQLVAISLADIVVKGSWMGPGRLHLVPHVDAPVAALPVRRVIGAHHFLADLTLPYGRVVYDYIRREFVGRQIHAVAANE
jgi:acetoacetate decarboxylase